MVSGAAVQLTGANRGSDSLGMAQDPSYSPNLVLKQVLLEKATCHVWKSVATFPSFPPSIVRRAKAVGKR